jgi:hypothetical protein
VTVDPTKKKTLDTNIGIQNDLPTPRCLMALRVLKLKILKMMAIDANANSNTRINVHSSQSSFHPVFRKKLYELVLSIQDRVFAQTSL